MRDFQRKVFLPFGQYTRGSGPETKSYPPLPICQLGPIISFGPAKANNRAVSCLFCCYLVRLGTMLVMSISPIHSWTVFLVAVEYFQAESLCMLNWTLFLRIQAGIKMLAGSNEFHLCRNV